MHGWIAVTHTDWFDFLAQRRHREEVNFWSPSDYVASFSRLPDWLAWECFGEGNGAATFEELKSRLDTLRARNKLRGAGGPQQIGCIVLVQAVFFPPDEWIPQPADWAIRNLRYTRYDLTAGEGARIWRACQERAASMPGVVREERARYGEPVLVRPRLGQGAFRVAVTDAYQRACAVTQEHSLPVLEAAHIVPFSRGGPHEISNGLLLRSDLHRLFDLGYVTVSPELRLEVSRRLRGDFENGRTYYPLHGSQVTVPADARLRPDPARLRWHNETAFRA
jgi:putative restriction endonuclease